jgi:hypothetical protein
MSEVPVSICKVWPGVKSAAIVRTCEANNDGVT